MKTFYNWPKINSPIAKQIPHTRSIHNDIFEDPYYWMNGFFKKNNFADDAIAYLEEENKYADSMMKDTEHLQKELFDEMKSRIKQKDESVPVLKNGYYYYTKTDDGMQYFKYCRKKGSLKAEEEVLLDIDKMADGFAYYSARGFSVSPNGKLLSYGVDTVSRRQYKIYVKDLETGEIIDDNIENTTGSVTWANDNETFFYTSKNQETLLTESINRHILRTNVVDDVTVYREEDKSNYIGTYSSKDNQFIFIYSAATNSSEVQFLDANNPFGEFCLFQKRIKNVLYSIVPLEDRFLILTNLDAQNFRIMECPMERTDVQYWQEVIPHNPDVLIEDLDEFKNFLVLTERYNALSRIRIIDRSNKTDYLLDFKEDAYVIYPAGNAEYDTDELMFAYNSMTVPPSVFVQNMKTKERRLVKQQEVLGEFDAKNYTSKRLFIESRDNKKIPVSIVYKNTTELNNKTPLLLYAYGAYGSTLDPTFSTTRLTLLNRGFVFAIAHVRGGEEWGRAWYDSGKMEYKINSFYDYIDVAEGLIKLNYTSNEKLYGQGGSAGGLLIGAVANLKPDLFNGLIAQVPFVDVINTMMDESIPLTTNEYEEWGNPNIESQYKHMLAYSPYDNVSHKPYPNMLITTGLHDSQVQYFEPAKWVAKLRQNNTSDNVILFKTEMDYGHGGASGRFDYLKEIALEFSFLLKLENLDK